MLAINIKNKAIYNVIKIVKSACRSIINEGMKENDFLVDL